MRRGLQYIARHRSRMVPTAACSSRSGPPREDPPPPPTPPVPPRPSPMPPQRPTNNNIWDDEEEEEEFLSGKRVHMVENAIDAMNKADYYDWLSQGGKAYEFEPIPKMTYAELESWAEEIEKAKAEAVGEVWDINRKIDYWEKEIAYWDQQADQVKDILKRYYGD